MTDQKRNDGAGGSPLDGRVVSLLRNAAMAGRIAYELEQRALPVEDRMAFIGPHLCEIAADEIDLLRELLAKRIGGAGLYRDDGELQDNSTVPFIDFRRDSAKDIARKLQDRASKHFLFCGG